MQLRYERAPGIVATAIVDKDITRIGRGSHCDVLIDGNQHPQVSLVHAEIRLRGNLATLVPLSTNQSTFVDNRPVQAATRLLAGSRIRLGTNGPVIEVASLAGEAGPQGQGDGSLGMDAGGKLESTGDIGRDQRSRYVLNHPLVSLRHARIAQTPRGLAVVDLGSEHGTFVNGHKLSAPTILQQGDSLDIGPFTFVLDSGVLVRHSRANNICLTGQSISKVVRTSFEGQTLSILNDVSVSIGPGEFCCIVGPSGSGKSTLLGILSGRDYPTVGGVQLNGRDLHSEFAILRQDVAVVPQVPAFHPTLSVVQTLSFVAALRLPADSSGHEIAREVEKALRTVGLNEKQKTPVAHLSGGQLKRLGLACELLSDPSLLFLDEVTSGLDEQADGEMMQLFQGLAQMGKSLICITHNLSHVDEYCSRLIILTNGGRLAFSGTPAEAKSWFSIDRLADVYGTLKKHSPEHWADKYQRSQASARDAVPSPQAASPKVRGDSKLTTSFVRQFATLVARNIAVWRSDTSALAAFIGQALIIAILLGLVFGKVKPAEPEAETTGKPSFAKPDLNFDIPKFKRPELPDVVIEDIAVPEVEVNQTPLEKFELPKQKELPPPTSAREIESLLARQKKATEKSVNEYRDRLQSQMNEQRDASKRAIAEQKEKMRSKVNDLRAKVDSQIAEHRERIEKQAAEQEEDIRTHIEEQNAKLKSEFEAQDEKFKTAMDDEEKEVRENIERDGRNLKRKGRIQNVLFLIGISCLWIGCNNSAKEIIKERKIFARERATGLSPEAFLSAKVVVMAVIALSQAAALSAIVAWWCDLPGERLGFVAISMILAIVGTLLGLAISAWSSSSDFAAAAVPAVILPQIILAGVILKLGESAEAVSQWLISMYGGQALYRELLFEADRVTQDVSFGSRAAWLVLAIHGGLYLALAVIGTRWKTFDAR